MDERVQCRNDRRDGRQRLPNAALGRVCPYIPSTAVRTVRQTSEATTEPLEILPGESNPHTGPTHKERDRRRHDKHCWVHFAALFLLLWTDSPHIATPLGTASTRTRSVSILAHSLTFLLVLSTATGREVDCSGCCASLLFAAGVHSIFLLPLRVSLSQRLSSSASRHQPDASSPRCHLCGRCSNFDFAYSTLLILRLFRTTAQVPSLQCTAAVHSLARPSTPTSRRARSPHSPPYTPASRYGQRLAPNTGHHSLG